MDTCLSRFKNASATFGLPSGERSPFHSGVYNLICSAVGVIFYGSVRDVEGLEEIKGFNGWIKGSDPSFIQQMMLTGINIPIRIGRATVLPGDIVLAKKTGTIFIPAPLVQDLVLNSEFTALRDDFGHQRLREGKYTPGQIDQQWTDEIKKDFLQWLNSQKNLPMSRKELDDYMKERNW